MPYRLFLTRLILFLLLIVLPHWQTVSAENNTKYTLSGHVKDISSGETLIGAGIAIAGLHTGTVSNSYGFYSLSLPPGQYSIVYSYVGYKKQAVQIDLNHNLVKDIALEPDGNELTEVTVESTRTNENVVKPEMSIAKLNSKTIQLIPALFGEIDVIKALQLLPGVQSTSEGATGFSVRGGNSDQNLILLDEASIQNASHLMGFFSVFNNDAFKDVTLYKGDMPSPYGGRLSSLVDVRSRDGNNRKFGGSGSVGLISSKLLLEGPIIKDRTSFLVAGRRTYADLFLPFAKDESARNSQLYFYDLNLKVMHTMDANNRLYLSGYMGRDIFGGPFARMGFGNQAASLRWNHLFGNKLFFNLSSIYSRYDYSLGTPDGEVYSFEWTSALKSYSFRFDFTHFITPQHTLRYGVVATKHVFEPGGWEPKGSNSAILSFVLPSEHALENCLYLGDEHKLNDKLTFKYTLRGTLFSNIGPGTYYNFDSLYKPIDSTVYQKNHVFYTHSNLEPRFSFTYVTSPSTSIKGNYSYSSQYLALAQNSTSGSPLDIWFPATPNVKPQLCQQIALGFYKNLKNNLLEFSLEAYYKDYRRVLDFRDHAQLLLNPYIEGEIRFGRGYSYGLEALIRKNTGPITGWVSYTYSRSYRIIPEINDGNRYPAPFDKPHSVNVVANYEFNKRLSASLTWVFATGVPVTFPTGRMVIGNVVLPVYSTRNGYRMPDYHRLDAGVILKGRENRHRLWRGEWNFSVYNLYNRHNAWSINFVPDNDTPYVTYAEKTYLFALIPSISYGIKIK